MGEFCHPINSRVVVSSWTAYSNCLKKKASEQSKCESYALSELSRPALKDRTETFDGLSMDCADNILASGMVNGGMTEVPAR